MTTINKDMFRKSTRFFGCSKDCDDVEMAISIKFKCSHPPQAFPFVSECVKGQDNFEIRFNSDKEECQVLIFPEEINLSSDEEIIEEVEDLDELEIVTWEE